MIIAIVQIPLNGPKRDTDFVTAQSVEAAKIFRDVKGLNRKYFLNGDSGGGGIYEFATKEEADAWFNDEWSDWMKSRFGVRPTLTIYHCPVVLDNELKEVRVGGTPITSPT